MCCNFVIPNIFKFSTPYCDDIYKPKTNQHFHTMKDAFSFYQAHEHQTLTCVSHHKNKTEKVIWCRMSFIVVMVGCA